jgi:hypothetical protein
MYTRRNGRRGESRFDVGSGDCCPDRAAGVQGYRLDRPIRNATRCSVWLEWVDAPAHVTPGDRAWSALRRRSTDGVTARARPRYSHGRPDFASVAHGISSNTRPGACSDFVRRGRHALHGRCTTFRIDRSAQRLSAGRSASGDAGRGRVQAPTTCTARYSSRNHGR